MFRLLEGATAGLNNGRKHKGRRKKGSTGYTKLTKKMGSLKRDDFKDSLPWLALNDVQPVPALRGKMQ